ncbi:MAG: penicillin acylase family protein [Caldilineaceae bacterium]
MRKLARFLLAIILLLALLGAGGYFYMRSSLPQTTGTVTVSGISGPVDIRRDDAGVPHIVATTDNDAIFALGYVHAQDRLWQMEMNRRIGNGRLSEVLGEAALRIDKFQRTMGYARVVRQNWELLSPRSRAFLETYAAGVNAFLNEGHTLPPEFLILGVTPEPWTVYDSLVWAKMMAWDLAGDYDLGVAAGTAGGSGRRGTGRTADAALSPAGRTIVTELPEALTQARKVADGAPAALGTIQALAALLDADALLALDTRFQQEWGLGGREIGSNNWVINGERSEDGAPVLANDPHLGTSIPAVWYLAEIQGETLHAVGSTLPGLPAIVIGHNTEIAWGMTNLDPDVQDLYMERINPANPNQVEVDGAWVDMTVVEEPIYIKGEREPLRWAARATSHGPLISDVTDTATPVALRWTALDGDDTSVDTFIAINFAANWEEFREAFRRFVGPSQNFIYADREGNIGYIGPGRIPIRAQGQGMIPVPGWDSSYGWIDEIPFDELPQMVNPPEGYIVTANNRVADERYPYLISNDWTVPYRADRIVELIEEWSANGETIGLDEMAAMHGDQRSLETAAMDRYLRRFAPQDPRQQQALAYLNDWDGTFTMESIAASIYEAWMVALPRALFADDLRGDLYEELANRANPTFLLTTLADPAVGTVWCDNVLSAPLESCEATALLALDTALDDLSDRLGDKMDNWQWGKLHRIQYPHRPFSEVPVLRWLFQRTIANGGNRYTINVAPVNLRQPYDQTHSPSYRQIVDLQNFADSRFSLTTAKSGNPLSWHYADRGRPTVMSSIYRWVSAAMGRKQLRLSTWRRRANRTIPARNQLPCQRRKRLLSQPIAHVVYRIKS